MSLPRLFLLICCAIFALSGCSPAAPPVSGWDLVLAAPAGATADAAQAAADAYAQATGLRVGVQTFSDDSYLDHIFAALLAGSGEFDLVYLSAESLPKWADYHTLQPLTLPGDENTAPWLSLVTVEGEVFGEPVEPDVDVLWYRTDVFEAAGLPSPADTNSWDEALTLVTSTGLPLAVSAGELDAGRDLAAVLEVVVAQQGDTWGMFDESILGGIVVYQRAVQMADPHAKNWTRADVQKALATGQAAMGILPLSASDLLQDCERSPDVCKDGEPLLAFAPLPGMEESLGVGSVQSWAVPLKAPHSEAARAFVVWLASEEGARAWAKGGGLPAHRAVLAEIDNPVAQALAQVEEFRPTFPPMIHATDIWQAMDTAGHGAAVGEPPEMLVEALVRSIETALRQSGYTVIEE